MSGISPEQLEGIREQERESQYLKNMQATDKITFNAKPLQTIQQFKINAKFQMRRQLKVRIVHNLHQIQICLSCIPQCKEFVFAYITTFQEMYGIFLSS